MNSPYIPTTRAEMVERGWDALYVIIVSRDSYIDSPYIGASPSNRSGSSVTEFIATSEHICNYNSMEFDSLLKSSLRPFRQVVNAALKTAHPLPTGADSGGYTPRQ
jgi:hypothetical protein